MFTLTTRRFEAAKSILEKYRELLQANNRFDTGSFEHELRACWKTGYREIKDIMLQLLKLDDYALVAAWYMQHSNGPGVVSEFKPSLAHLYGMTRYDSSDRKERQQQFWETAFSGKE